MQTAPSTHSSPPASPWLVFPKPNPQAQLRLFCLPYAGAGPIVYRVWPDHLPASVEVVSIHYPGRESRFRETPYAAMRPLVDTLVTEMLPFFDRPFAFFGHSLGSLIAFEVARRLRQTGAPLPVHLLISSRRAPHMPETLNPIHGLDDEAFTAAVVRRYNGIPPVILEDPELLALFLPVLKADFSIFETYAHTPEAPFDFPISTFVGLQDPGVSPQDMTPWQAHTTQPIASHTFPGDHFYLQSQRSLLLQALSSRLNGTN